MIKIVHMKLHKQTNRTVYIGRPSPLGNPFKIGKDGSRAEVIEKYETWLRGQVAKGSKEVLGELARIEDIIRSKGSVELMCWCAPWPCHGDAIKKVIEERLQ